MAAKTFLIMGGYFYINKKDLFSYELDDLVELTVKELKEIVVTVKWLSNGLAMLRILRNEKYGI